MFRIAGIVIACFCVILVAPAAAPAVTIDWSPVGDPGNAADVTGYGAVGYSYNIGTYDVTNRQYVEFLNAKDPTGANTLGLWGGDGDAYAMLGGISYDAGATTGNKYAVIAGDGNLPVNYVSWYSAIRFANWMDNGQGNGDTETGAYTLRPLGPDGVPVNGDGIIRNTGASVFLPSENEWYKAAYYNHGTSSYFYYPTSSDMPPIASGPTGLPNHANFDNVVGSLTDVGAYTGTTSPYGAFDMGGNVAQWNEALIGRTATLYARGLLGGAFFGDSGLMQSSFANSNFPSNEEFFIGFRLASIPGSSVFADVNHDHIINSQDLAIISSNWLQTGMNLTGDANGDGIVNAQDIALVSANWLEMQPDKSSGSTPVPEPCSLFLAALGGMALLAMYRRD